MATTAERMRAYRARHAEKIRERERERMRARRAGGYREVPEKKRARNLLNDAVRHGRIERQPCEVCGETKSQAHHDDYSKPLDVRWLCRAHHEEAHAHA